jgi:hypothetical protein
MKSTACRLARHWRRSVGPGLDEHTRAMPIAPLMTVTCCCPWLALLLAGLLVIGAWLREEVGVKTRFSAEEALIVLQNDCRRAL